MLRKKLRLSFDPEASKGKTEQENIHTSNTNYASEMEGTVDSERLKANISHSNVADEILQREVELNSKLHHLTFTSPVKYVYNPVEYAYDTHAQFVKKFCDGKKKIMLLGMNPGPWGMCQTGIPFGEITMVRDWYGIHGTVSKPAVECPNRPITGFNCQRSEQSGKRLYQLFKNVCITPENLFKNAFLHNFCPLAMMDSSGRNITPASLKVINGE